MVSGTSRYQKVRASIESSAIAVTSNASVIRPKNRNSLVMKNGFVSLSGQAARLDGARLRVDCVAVAKKTPLLGDYVGSGRCLGRRGVKPRKQGYPFVPTSRRPGR